MAEIRVKRVASMSPAYLKAGELGVAGDYLYFGRYQAGDSTLSATKIALQDTSNNVFTNVNTFKYSNDGANAMEFQDAGGTTKYYLKAGRLSTDLTSFNNADLVNKLYVDGLVQGLDIKASVKIATSSTFAIGSLAGTKLEITSNTGSSGLFIEIDGVQLSVAISERILYYGTFSAVYNGIWKLDSVTGTGPYTGIFSRTADANIGTELVNAFVFVETGALADTGWVCTNDSITIGTTSITWTQFSGAGTYKAGTGLTLAGNLFNHTNSVAAAASAVRAITIDAQGHISAYGSAITSFTPSSHTQATLNGTPSTAPSFFAPTTSATTGYLLKAVAGNNAPTWSLLTSSEVTTALGFSPTSSSGITSVSISSGSTNGYVSLTANGVTTSAFVTGLGSMAYVANIGTTAITTLGTITNGTWSATAISPNYGGTGLTGLPLGAMLYGSATNVWSILNSNTTATAKYLRSISSGTPTWGQIAYSEISGTPNVPISASSDVLYATGGTNTTAYNATTARTANRFYRHADMPVTSSTASALKYDGVLYAYQFEGIIDGGVWGA